MPQGARDSRALCWMISVCAVSFGSQRALSPPAASPAPAEPLCGACFVWTVIPVDSPLAGLSHVTVSNHPALWPSLNSEKPALRWRKRTLKKTDQTCWKHITKPVNSQSIRIRRLLGKNRKVLKSWAWIKMDHTVCKRWAAPAVPPPSQRQSNCCLCDN